MKVVILSCNTGGGHNSAAKAIAKELASRNIECEIKDALLFVPKAKREFIENGHSFMYKHAPNLYAMSYEFTEKQKSHYLVYLEFARYAMKLMRYIIENEFDTAICVHEFPAFMLTHARKMYDFPIKQYFVVTDYTFTPGVEETDMDGWFIPRGFSDEFAEHELPIEKMFETGIPVDSDCYRKMDKSEARKKLNIRDEMPVILISAGSIGCGPIKELALKIKELSNDEVCVAVLCGNNKKLLKDLAQEVDDSLLIPITFTNKVNYWMAASDAMILKAGGLSTTEAASKNIPMIIMNAAPGLESRNMDYYLKNGCAVTATEVDELAKLALIYASDAEKANEIMNHQKELFSKNSVAELVNTVIDNEK